MTPAYFDCKNFNLIHYSTCNIQNPHFILLSTIPSFFWTLGVNAIIPKKVILILRGKGVIFFATFRKSILINRRAGTDVAHCRADDAAQLSISPRKQFFQIGRLCADLIAVAQAVKRPQRLCFCWWRNHSIPSWNAGGIKKKYIFRQQNILLWSMHPWTAHLPEVQIGKILDSISVADFIIGAV